MSGINFTVVCKYVCSYFVIVSLYYLSLSFNLSLSSISTRIPIHLLLLSYHVIFVYMYFLNNSTYYYSELTIIHSMYFLNNSTYYYSELTIIHSSDLIIINVFSSHNGSYLIIINVFSSHNGSFYLILSTCVNITLFISNYIANGSYINLILYTW